MKIEKVNFCGWKNCVQITSGDFRLIATTEVGPRIIGAFFGDSENLFFVDPETAGKKGGKSWNGFGGHRLWHSPEEFPRTYTVDNSKVEYKTTRNSVVFQQPADSLSGIEKSIEIIPGKKDMFRIVHTLTNRNAWTVECGAWAITMMAPGGTGIFPMPQSDKKGLLPNISFAFWPYNNMADGRCTIGSKYTLLKQDPAAKGPMKIGYNCEDGWIAYQNNGVTFIKKFEHMVDGEYPDNGCSAECYSNDKMQEMETLSPFYELAPGETITYTEEWHALALGSPAITCEKDAVEVFG